MSLYVMLRVCWKPGPAAAALAGIVMWLAFSVTGPAQFIPLGFFSHALVAQGRCVSPGHLNHRDNRGRGDLQRG